MAILDLQTRLSIYERAQQGCTDRQNATEHGCSRSAVRKWRRRLAQAGRAGAQTRLGRPVRGALSSFAAPVVTCVQGLRQAHPGWGPQTLRLELTHDESLRPYRLPSRASIALWLRAHDCPRVYQRHHALPTPALPPAVAPHQVWQRDGRGQAFVPEVGVIELININDVCSRAKLLSYPCDLGRARARVTRLPNGLDYQLALRLAFCQWGLPEWLAVDHASVFYDNQSPSPFPTAFHLWLVGLGVQLTFCRPDRPTDQGQTERSHQTWQQQVLAGQTFADWSSLYHALQARRTFLNECLPCATLDHQPPLVAYPNARIPRRAYRPEYEARLFDLMRVHVYLTQCHWFRTVHPNGVINLGGQTYGLGVAWLRHQVEITFDLADGQFVIRDAAGTLIQRVAPKGLSAATLMGELDQLTNLPFFQLHLPFSLEDWRVTRLC